MTGGREEEVVLTEAEWRAVLMGARALRAAGAAQGGAEVHTLAWENARDADVLAGLARRSVVRAEPSRRTEQAHAPDGAERHARESEAER